MEHSVLALLHGRFAAAAAKAFGPDVELPGTLVLPTKDPRHGDYQCSVAMALA